MSKVKNLIYGGVTLITIRTIERKDYQSIVDWNNAKDEDYLFQWSGLKTYVYPISVEQIESHAKESSIYMIEKDDMTIGSIELSNINNEKKTAFVCRFIFQEEMRNKGYGKCALEKLCKMAFEKINLETLKLRVYCFNVGAIRCYEQVGFLIKDYHQQSDSKWNYYTMELVK